MEEGIDVREPIEERIDAIRSLKNAKWDLHTLINLNAALFDRSQRIRIAALEALMGLAKKVPEPIDLFPVDLLAYHMFDVTVASGYTPYIFRHLVHIRTPEATEAAKKALKMDCRNEDFKEFIDAIIEEKRSDLLQYIKKESLSKTKTGILQAAIKGNF